MKRKTLAELDATWVVCPKCDGDEGYFDDEKNEWVDCPTCEGAGGWSK